MRTTSLVLAVVFCACGSTDAVRGAGSVGAPADGGDAPSGSGGTPLPPTTNSCGGIAPPDKRAMAQYVQIPWYEPDFSCGNAAADASGNLALVVSGGHGDVVDVVDATGKLLHSPFMSMWGFVLPQPHGFTEVSGRPYIGPEWAVRYGQMISNFDSAGNSTGRSVLANHSGQSNLPAAAAPNGGVLLAGDLAMWPNDAIVHAAVMYNGGNTAAGVRWGPKTLASPGPVFGVGVDVLDRSLVITDGTPSFGMGNISGQWFDNDGTPLTSEFVLVRGFSPGTSTWFETAPIIGGGLLVRRRDGNSHTQALVVVDSGSTSVRAAPDWMAARRDVKLELARGGKAYAVLPLAASGVSCMQRVEVIAPDGTSCGAADYPIASATCDTLEMWLGSDGTIIQQLPTAMEQTNDIVGGHTCTWRWWTAALR